VRERPNRHAWKACDGKLSVGSNPTSSAVSSMALLLGVEMFDGLSNGTEFDEHAFVAVLD
jgi:predicted SpoU family rRNA methylase